MVEIWEDDRETFFFLNLTRNKHNAICWYDAITMEIMTPQVTRSDSPNHPKYPSANIATQLSIKVSVSWNNPQPICISISTSEALYAGCDQIVLSAKGNFFLIIIFMDRESVERAEGAEKRKELTQETILSIKNNKASGAFSEIV